MNVFVCYHYSKLLINLIYITSFSHTSDLSSLPIVADSSDEGAKKIIRTLEQEKLELIKNISGKMV